MKILMRATFETLIWESDEPDTEPTQTHGYTDPTNPWGGLRSEIPEGLIGEAFTAWRNENIETVEFDSLWEAAEFIVEFPGGVWDYRETEHQTTNYYTGETMEVTLHVEAAGDEDEDPDVVNEAVFAVAAIIQRANDKALAATRKVRSNA